MDLGGGACQAGRKARTCQVRTNGPVPPAINPIGRTANEQHATVLSRHGRGHRVCWARAGPHAGGGGGAGASRAGRGAGARREEQKKKRRGGGGGGAPRGGGGGGWGVPPKTKDLP